MRCTTDWLRLRFRQPVNATLVTVRMIPDIINFVGFGITGNGDNAAWTGAIADPSRLRFAA